MDQLQVDLFTGHASPNPVELGQGAAVASSADRPLAIDCCCNGQCEACADGCELLPMFLRRQAE